MFGVAAVFKDQLTEVDPSWDTPSCLALRQEALLAVRLTGIRSNGPQRGPAMSGGEPGSCPPDRTAYLKLNLMRRL